ncbi:MAG: ATP:cob(I)alamin adenosyltransferase [Candidatus Colwellbacteria bacterium RIFCSPLOWO2_01_FULL_48_10]|uniref:Corrinoid adenosyltransferase n=2 Tax=Bacteria candidate phyla TaxID=1783234 RepID=A0A1F5P2U0_9BACT|nr:MAG: ATP:cob(I)alamin adenosyltransferase [Candidatus Doudnabacteria bacterium RIFCSPHIGHO2_01_FULL_49_9]OGY59521.1 MAG: ATP:cob(I)alamin adenosyltransferase [Candidatus Colwellbacteria bacterium RIFCSPLOWO2_01_FULL_48_10]
MGLFYTGKGDKGKSVVGKKKIDKTSADIEVLGELDELNSLLGLVKSKLGNGYGDFAEIINRVQENLFIIQANIANFMFGGKYKAPAFGNDKISEIESIINDFEFKIKPEKGFVISGTDEISGWLDFARAVSRRVERRILKLSKTRKISPGILAYMNRLSSLLFALARMEAHSAKKKEAHPSYK